MIWPIYQTLAECILSLWPGVIHRLPSLDPRTIVNNGWEERLTKQKTATRLVNISFQSVRRRLDRRSINR